MRKHNRRRSETNLNRRRFLRSSAILTGTALIVLPGTAGITALQTVKADNMVDHHPEEELLYNGIILPAEWPPRDMKPDVYEPMPVPYLKSPPAVIPFWVSKNRQGVSGGSTAAGGPGLTGNWDI